MDPDASATEKRWFDIRGQTQDWPGREHFQQITTLARPKKRKDETTNLEVLPPPKRVKSPKRHDEDDDETPHVINMRPADAYMTHQQPVYLGPGADADERQLNQYFVPRSDGIDFTERDAVNLGNLNANRVADLMNRVNYDDEARSELLTQMPTPEGKKDFMWRMDKNLARQGGRFTPSWLRSQEARALSLETEPLYVFAKQVAGTLNVNRVELLLDEQQIRSREEAIKQGVEQTRHAYESRVKSAEVAWTLLQNTETRYNAGKEDQNALFGYYLPEIDIGRHQDPNKMVQDLEKNLTKFPGTAALVFSDNDNLIDSYSYPFLFLRAIALAGALHIKTTANKNFLEKIGFILQSEFLPSSSGVAFQLNSADTYSVCIAELKTEKLYTDLAKTPSDKLQALLASTLRRLKEHTRGWDSVLHETVQVLAYGVSTRGSGPPSEILFIDASLRNAAKRLAEAPVLGGRSAILIDPTNPDVTVRSRDAEKLTNIKLNRILLQPPMPYMVTTENRDYWAFVTPENRALIWAEETDKAAIDQALQIFDQVISPLSDHTHRWSLVQLQLNSDSRGTSIPSRSLSDFPLWATRELTYYQSQRPAAKPTIDRALLVIDSLRAGIMLYSLATHCDALYTEIVNSKNKESDSGIAINERITQSHAMYALALKMANKLALHAFLDIRFGFWYLILVYNFVRDMLTALSEWLSRPGLQQLNEARQAWAEISAGATDVDALRRMIESPDVAGANLEYWQLPENSGYITLGPALAAGINDATNFVRQNARDPGFKTFTAEEVTNNCRLSESSQQFRQFFVSLVALKIAQNRRLAPVAYMTQLTDRAIQVRTLDLMTQVMEYRVEGSRPNRRFVWGPARNKI